MDEPRSVAAWMAERSFDAAALLRLCPLDKKVLTAILEGRYTPSPQQRQQIAAALGGETAQVAFGSGIEVQHLHGHGPQFGRTP